MTISKHRRPARLSWAVIGGVGLVVVATLAAVVFTPKAQPVAPRNIAVNDLSSVIITAIDGVNLTATEKSPVRNVLSPAVILLHEYGQDRHQWDAYLATFIDAGFVVLSYDMRGFGDSRLAAIPTTTDAHLNSLPHDVADVVAYLKQQPHIDSQRISIIGAGIGANVAFVASGSAYGLFRTVLLSPSTMSGVLDGAGIDQFAPANILGVASTTEMQDLRTMMAKVSGDHETFEVDGGSRGMSLLTNTQTLQKIVDWLRS